MISRNWFTFLKDRKKISNICCFSCNAVNFSFFENEAKFTDEDIS